MARIGGELDVESWEGGVCPAFVSLDLGLTQRQGNYASGTIFQAVLVGGVSFFLVGCSLNPCGFSLSVYLWMNIVDFSGA